MAENCASIKSAGEIVSGMSLSLVKAEFIHKLYKETKGLQHQLVTIYRRSLLIRS